MHVDIENQSNMWTHWDLNPGPSACEADVIPLHHEPMMACRTVGEESWAVVCWRCVRLL